MIFGTLVSKMNEDLIRELVRLRQFKEALALLEDETSEGAEVLKEALRLQILYESAESQK